jgi:hypothetical protein
LPKKTFDQMWNTCVPKALRDLTGKSEAEVMRECKRRGWSPRTGMTVAEAIVAGANLGISLDRIPHVASATMQSLIHDRNCRRRLVRGRWLIFVAHHAFAIRHGQLVGSTSIQDLRAPIQMIFRVDE